MILLPLFMTNHQFSAAKPMKAYQLDYTDKAVTCLTTFKRQSLTNHLKAHLPCQCFLDNGAPALPIRNYRDASC